MTSQIHVAPLRAWLAERPAAWRIGAVLIGSWVIAASSWISAPMYPVPMTMQTFAVLLVAGMAGARLGFAIVATWLTQAALGLPFLADGAGGLDAPSALALQGDVLYVGSRLGKKVLKFDARDGAFIGTFADLPSNPEFLVPAR